MADVDSRVEFRVAARLENLAIVRTLIGAVGTFEDLDFDAIADLRLAVDEACTRLVRCAVPGAELVVKVYPREDALVVDASSLCGSGDDLLTPGSFSWHVLSSLTDDLRTFSDGTHNGDRICGISMTARRVSSLR